MVFQAGVELLFLCSLCQQLCALQDSAAAVLKLLLPLTCLQH